MTSLIKIESLNGGMPCDRPVSSRSILLVMVYPSVTIVQQLYGRLLPSKIRSIQDGIRWEKATWIMEYSIRQESTWQHTYYWLCDDNLDGHMKETNLEAGSPQRKNSKGERSARRAKFFFVAAGGGVIIACAFIGDRPPSTSPPTFLPSQAYDSFRDFSLTAEHINTWSSPWLECQYSLPISSLAHPSTRAFEPNYSTL